MPLSYLNYLRLVVRQWVIWVVRRASLLLRNFGYSSFDKLYTILQITHPIHNNRRPMTSLSRPRRTEISPEAFQGTLQKERFLSKSAFF